MKKFTEQLTFVAGVEFGDAFNCVWLREYFTYEGEPYRDNATHVEHQLDELDETIADAVSANEKKALRDKKAGLTARHEAKSEGAIKAEDAGRMEEFRMAARRRHQKIDKLDKSRRNCSSPTGRTCLLENKSVIFRLPKSASQKWLNGQRLF